MTERELAGVIASLRATAESIRSGVVGGRRIGTLDDGQAVLLSVSGMEAVIRSLEDICDLLIEAIPNDAFIVERHAQKEQELEGEAQEKRSQTEEEG